MTSHQIPGPNGAEAFFENMTDESRLAGMVGALPIAWESNLLPGFNLQYMNAYGSDAPTTPQHPTMCNDLGPGHHHGWLCVR